MPNYFTQILFPRPGIQRDGTKFSSQHYIDGQWTRFYMNLPRKIGGYKAIHYGNTEIIRTLFNVPGDNSVDTYFGRKSSVQYINFDFNGNGSVQIDRTPIGYVVNDDNIWVFDLFSTDTNTFIIAQVAPNGSDMSNTTEGNLYYGDIELDSPLTIINDTHGNPITASGGAVFVSPVLVVYGNNGLLRWSAEGDLTNWPDNNSIVIDNTKIVNALVARGSTAPQILCWTINSLYTATYTQINGENVFQPAPVQSGISIISANSIVQYDNQFFWIGTDCFYSFNGIIQNLPNSMSSDWFFNNVNLTARTKIWGMAIPRYKEIWWFYPSKTSPECDSVIIYNLESKVWYDSKIGRSAGLQPGTFPFPMMADTQPSFTLYPLWMHEYGTNKIYQNQSTAIESHYETSIITLFKNEPSNNRLMRSRRIEPDFNINGNMTVTVNNRMFPNSPIISDGPYTFNQSTEKIDNINSQGRLVSFVFSSNEIDGDYQAGHSILGYDVGDVRP